MTNLSLKTLGAALIWLAVSGVAHSQQTLVVGHKTPDTDAIVSAIAVAQLKSAQGVPAKAVAQGEPNAETRFVLQTFGFDAPPVHTEFAGREVILVDHSDAQLAPYDLGQAKLVGIYDHHKLGGLATDEPIEVIVKPWGSTATILYEVFGQAGVKIDAPLAGLLLSAVLSDTRVFRSPTTTEHDKQIANELAKIAGITDLQAYGLQMLRAYNEDMAKLDDASLVRLDLKIFKMGASKIGIAQLEAYDATFLTQRLPGLKQALDNELADNQLDAMVLAVTDLNRDGSTILAVGPQAAKAQSALGLSTDSLGTFKPSILSRKRQLVPPLESAFKS